jgi:hypothetical protein
MASSSDNYTVPIIDEGEGEPREPVGDVLWSVTASVATSSAISTSDAINTASAAQDGPTGATAIVWLLR